MKKLNKYNKLATIKDKHAVTQALLNYLIAIIQMIATGIWINVTSFSVSVLVVLILTLFAMILASYQFAFILSKQLKYTDNSRYKLIFSVLMLFLTGALFGSTAFIPFDAQLIALVFGILTMIIGILVPFTEIKKPTTESEQK